MKNQYKGGLPKKGAWAICRFKGVYQKKGVLRVGWGCRYPNVHYGMSLRMSWRLVWRHLIHCTKNKIYLVTNIVQ